MHRIAAHPCPEKEQKAEGGQEMQVGANMLEEKSPQKCSSRNCKISEIKACKTFVFLQQTKCFLQAPRIDQGKHRTTESTLYIADVEKSDNFRSTYSKDEFGKGKVDKCLKRGVIPSSVIVNQRR